MLVAVGVRVPVAVLVGLGAPTAGIQNPPCSVNGPPVKVPASACADGAAQAEAADRY